ncbi:MAG: hypothetical protein SPH96_04100 [Agathobacter sp.]|nr:hypothetical protein [Agathobacter sp.]
MGAIIVILIIGAIVYYSKVYNSPNARAVRAVCQGKTPEQTKAIEYFCKEGCMTKTISDDEYLQMVREKRDSLNLRQKALNKIGLDEDEVSEISPASFEGFVYKNAYAKKNASGHWVSSAYQVAWLFFSSTQIYIYRHTFNMDEDKKSESTDEFFYKDVTSFSTASETETAHGLGDNKFEVESNKFKMVVPGDQIFVSMDGVSNSEQIIQAMKQKLREKKM